MEFSENPFPFFGELSTELPRWLVSSTICCGASCKIPALKRKKYRRSVLKTLERVKIQPSYSIEHSILEHFSFDMIATDLEGMRA